MMMPSGKDISRRSSSRISEQESITYPRLMQSWNAELKNEKIHIFKKPFDKLPVKELIRALDNIADYEERTLEYNESVIDCMFFERFEGFATRKGIDICVIPDDKLAEFRKAFDAHVINNWMDYFKYVVLVYRMSDLRWDDVSAPKNLPKIGFFTPDDVEDVLKNSIGKDTWFHGVMVDAVDLINKVKNCDNGIVVDADKLMIGTMNIEKHDAYYVTSRKKEKVYFDLMKEYMIDAGEIGGVFRRSPWKFK